MSAVTTTLNKNIDCSEFVSKVHELVDQNLNLILSQQNTPCPVLKKCLEYTVLSTGKKLRAAMVLALSDNFEQDCLLIDSACAIELIHTYSLIHDDLPCMDDDDVRRGKPSCHIAFNEATAILAGDSLQSLAFELISQHNTQPDKALKIIRILSQAIGHMGMVGGQSLELNQTGLQLSSTPTKLELLDQIHLLKTAKLFTACLQIATILSPEKINPNNLPTIIKLGENLGLAFQIQDDLLDYQSSTQHLGKPSGSDAKRGLPTYSSLIGYEHAQDILNNLWQACDKIIKELKLNNTNLRAVVDLVKNRSC